jgi:translocation protein SEC63
MAGQYKYDNEGAQFLTFLLTFLLAALLPLTYSLVPGRSSSGKGTKQGWFDAKGQKDENVKKITNRSFANPRLSGKIVLVISGWAAVAYLFHSIANAATTTSHAIYDPFSVLGIAASATEKQIKSHYKKLSIKFHPDKVRLAENQTKEDAESHFVNLTKAYKALTDETIRKNFELYGHPDGRQEMSMGIALPAWVVEGHNNIWVLGIYGVVFGLALPYLVARWWYGSRSRTKDGLINATAQSYFQHLREDTPPARILALVAVSEELQDPLFDKRGPGADEDELSHMESLVRARLRQMGERWRLIDHFRSHSIRKNLILLYSHVLRINSKSPKLTKDRYIVGAKAERLLNGMLSISLAHNWMDMTIQLMDMLQCLVQAVPPSSEMRSASELMQLPGMTLEAAQAVTHSNAQWGHLGLQGFWKMGDQERRKGLRIGQSDNLISEQQYKDAVGVLGEWPRIEMVDAFFKVTGEKIVTPGAVVQFIVKIRALPFKKDGTLLFNGVRANSDLNKRDTDSSVRPSNEEDDENESKQNPALEGKQAIGYAHAPLFLEERKPNWWVFLADAKQSRIIVQPVKCTDIGPDAVRTFSIQFQAPPQVGLYSFRAIVKSDVYLGSEAEMSVLLKVDDASELEIEDYEDDISDPEEDTLAGQMAAMRGERVKAARLGDEGEDESSSEEAGGEHNHDHEGEDSESDWD